MNDYATSLEGLTDEKLTDEVETKVWLSSFAANNPRSKYHKECDATWDECQRRKKPWLYQRGWNAAFVSCGHSLSERDREMENPSYYNTPTERKDRHEQRN